MAVIDASVYIALINAHEQDHANSWNWFQKTQDAREPIVAPKSILAEGAAALSRGVGDVGLVQRAVGQLRISGLIELVPVTISLAERAAAIAAEHRIRGCHAVYVAIADQLSDSLVTLDRQQLERAAGIVSAGKPF